MPQAFAQHSAARVLWLPSIRAGMNYNKHEGRDSGCRRLQLPDQPRRGLRRPRGRRRRRGLAGDSRHLCPVPPHGCHLPAADHRLRPRRPRVPRRCGDQRPVAGNGSGLSGAARRRCSERRSPPRRPSMARNWPSLPATSSKPGREPGRCRSGGRGSGASEKRSHAGRRSDRGRLGAPVAAAFVPIRRCGLVPQEPAVVPIDLVPLDAPAGRPGRHRPVESAGARRQPFAGLRSRQPPAPRGACPVAAERAPGRQLRRLWGGSRRADRRRRPVRFRRRRLVGTAQSRLRRASGPRQRPRPDPASPDARGRTARPGGPRSRRGPRAGRSPPSE